MYFAHTHNSKKFGRFNGGLNPNSSPIPCAKGELTSSYGDERLTELVQACVQRVEGRLDTAGEIRGQPGRCPAGQ